MSWYLCKSSLANTTLSSICSRLATTIKINKAEEILLTQRVNKSGLTASEYIRQSVLHDNPVAVIDKANIIIPQLADISSLTNDFDLLDCDTLPPNQRDIVNLIQKGVHELWKSLRKQN